MGVRLCEKCSEQKPQRLAMKNFRILLPYFFVALMLATFRGANAFDFSTLPGTEGFTGNLKSQLEHAYSARNSEEVLRTQFIRDGGTPVYVNRMILERSPYLRQHAHNPVNWYPWGEEAFEVAKKHNIPLLLSIGYSTCHWCHVMEHETYDNEYMAEIINRTVIPVKIDREIHPEIDEIYITAMQVISGRGGWPLNVFVTPDGDPFYGGIYFPPENFEMLLRRVDEVWRESRPQTIEIAKQISAIVRDYSLAAASDTEIGDAEINQVVAEIANRQKSIDDFEVDGNRFPRESELFLLLDIAMRDNNEAALKLSNQRLTEMALGGIRDHIGGGFHRYTVDVEWLVPHFEKMLYNQAHLGRAYLYGYWLTGDPLFRRVAEQLLEYVLRELTDSNGIFYSATDADSGGEEGEYFIWTPDEIYSLLDKDDAELIIELYGITDRGNFEGKNIFHLAQSLENHAENLQLKPELLVNSVDEFRKILFAARNQREKPFLDKKAITAWNGMMITTLSEAHRILNNERYLAAAEKAAEFLWEHNVTDEGKLLRIYLNGESSVAGKLGDYAYFLEAMIKLYDQTMDRKWLERSEILAEDMLERFWDEANGGLYTAESEEAKNLIARQKDRYDNALPSGNSVAVKAFAALFQRTGKSVYKARANQIIRAFSNEIAESPTSFTYALAGLLELDSGQVGEREFAAAGNVSAHGLVVKQSAEYLEANVQIQMSSNWHINSSSPMTENLIATQLSTDPNSGWKIADIDYPDGSLIEAAFQSGQLSVYSDRVSIPIKFNRTNESATAPVVTIDLQACNDELCLLPESIKLEFSPALASYEFTG